jgi:hypothetical protein
MCDCGPLNLFDTLESGHMETTCAPLRWHLMARPLLWGGKMATDQHASHPCTFERFKQLIFYNYAFAPPLPHRPEATSRFAHRGQGPPERGRTTAREGEERNERGQGDRRPGERPPTPCKGARGATGQKNTEARTRGWAPPTQTPRRARPRGADLSAAAQDAGLRRPHAPQERAERP